MSLRPKVTVWIPSYNHARFLPAALDSVLAQTFRDFELVVVDDGSTDGSLRIAREYEARHPGVVRVHTHPGGANRGISATVNLAFELARGEYVMGLPSDDMLHPEKLERQVEFLERERGCGWVYGHAEYIDDEGSPRPEWGLFGRDVTRAPDPVETLIQANVVPGMTALMRREVYARAHPHDESLVYSDWHFWVKMLALSEAGFVERPLVLYRAHSYNTSLNRDPHENQRRFLEVMEALRRDADAVGGRLARPRTRALLGLQVAYHLYCLGERAGARREFQAAFATDPALLADVAYVNSWLRQRMFQIFSAFGPESPESDFSAWVLANLPEGAGRVYRRRVAALTYAIAAFRRCDVDISGTRARSLRCLFKDPTWLRDVTLRSVLINSLIGRSRSERLRQLKRAIVQEGA